MSKLTIEDLLNALENPAKVDGADITWERIAAGDKFPELGLEGSELKKFLVDWISENPYSSTVSK